MYILNGNNFYDLIKENFWSFFKQNALGYSNHAMNT